MVTIILFYFEKAFFYSCRMQMKACIYTESKFLDNTETKMYLLRIFTEGEKSYFVEQPFLAGYLFLQKTVYCRSSLRDYFWIISYTFFSSNLTYPEPSSYLWFQLSKWLKSCLFLFMERRGPTFLKVKHMQL